ncbi:MAG: hypothetical protein FJ279_07615 [Planctomycetes bacterium]|nr:hypothetical protein [Planctomycetota bacterium]
MSRAWLWIGLCLALAGTVGAVHAQQGGEAAKDIVRFDFESGDLQGWRVVEGAFGKFVCDRAVFHHDPKPYNKQGKFFLSTLESRDNRPDDRFMGVAESPVFMLSGPRMSLLIGGGKHPETYVALCTLDGKEVLKAQGVNSQTMQRVEWNAPELVGNLVYLRLVDKHTGGWGHITFDDFSAVGKIDPAATEKNFAAAGLRLQLREVQARLDAVNPDALRSAIQDLMQSFPTRYPRGQEFLGRLSQYEKRLAEVRAGGPNLFGSPGPNKLGTPTDGTAADQAPLKQIRDGGPNLFGTSAPNKLGTPGVDEAALKQAGDFLAEFSAFQREALAANPLVCGQPILFVVRHQYKPDHHNTETMFQTGEINTTKFQGGGAMKVVDFGKGGEVRTLVEAPEGVVRDPEVHFSGRKIVFAMRKNVKDDYHIYEVNADGSGLRQLTFASGVSDIDPLYLPDDTIAFSGTREPKYCMCNRHIMANLFRMAADGANIHQIGKNTLFEGHGALMPDGRILYDRWEYVDRNFGDAQGLWVCNPDGTNHAIYYGNNTPSPGAVLDGRPIPGTPQALCIFSSCHDRPWGALAILDTRLGVDGRAPVARLWPASALDLVKDPGAANNVFDAFVKVTPKYEDPYPLSDKYFLCSRMTGKGEQMGIYLVDVFGNETLLHVEEPGCYDPMPLSPRPRPLAIPSRRNFENKDGYFYVHDVYQGTHMADVKRGAVKFLRVVESPEKRFWTGPAWGGQGQEAPAMNWHDFNNKRILGTAPVEEDGSAYFAVPSDAFVYFQLLDENGMMIQSMRSGTMVQSGERTGCVGCHDDRLTAPPSRRGGMALRRPPSQLNGWYGPPRLFSYMAEVQPVFDKHCVRCHDFGTDGGKKLLLAADRNPVFNVSYSELWRKKFIKVVGGGPAEIQPAYSWGSHASKLVEFIRKAQHRLNLDKESIDRIVTWVDLNAPYYPTYASAYPDNPFGRSPLDGKQWARLCQLLGADPKEQANVTQIAFERPELSPGLAKFADKNDPNYKEALALIQAGAEMLRKRPRADMPGFQPCETDRRREAKYVQRRQAELRHREALCSGKRAYDDPSQ